ncbi:MAG: hypothetical protein LBL81_01150, partial [Tannerella sp.]|nr:hypothetical protein [Tannerella sp.]
MITFAAMQTDEKRTFGSDLEFLSRHDEPVLLGEGEMRQVLVSPKYQGKVFTSTAEGLEGRSLGYLNYAAFGKATPDPHMNGYGGENRLWVGPEGGRFSVFIRQGDEQVYANWHTPPAFDTEPWTRTSSRKDEVVMEKEMELENYLGTRFRLRAERSVRLLDEGALCLFLRLPALPEGLRWVAYSTANRLSNLNDFPWTPQSGTLCLWMADMLKTSSRSFSFAPYLAGSLAERGAVATSDYFGPIPEGRYREAGGLVFLRTDGRLRSKIGLSARRTRGLLGNYDPLAGHLTLAAFSMDAQTPYLNQEWDTAKDPMQGDVMHAYNDGPLDDGSQMGPF